MDTKLNVVRVPTCGHFMVTAENADGTLVYGQALAAKMSELTELVMKSNHLQVKFGPGHIPVHVAVSLPELPEGYEFVIGIHYFGRERDPYEGNVLDCGTEYEWRVFAVRIGSILNEDEEAVSPGTPVLMGFNDEALRVHKDLPPDSLEWKSGAWIACDAILTTLRFRGKDLPPPPEGYGIVRWYDDYKGRGGATRIVAVPCGSYHTLHSEPVYDTFIVGGQEARHVYTDGDRGPYWTPPEDNFVFDEESGSWQRPKEHAYW